MFSFITDTEIMYKYIKICIFTLQIMKYIRYQNNITVLLFENNFDNINQSTIL